LGFLGTEIRCKKCDHVLFEFDGVPNDLLWYSKLRYKLDGECPNCGHKLPNILRYAKKMQFKVKSTIPVIAE
jgi:DNA-directed RNA polymerase subunit RPC12/RpoP